MKYKLQIEKLKQLKMDGNLAMANQLESQDEGYTPFEMDLLNQITDLKKEKIRLTKKLEYCYEKTYLILNNLDDKNDVLKLFDAVEEFKPLQMEVNDGL